MLLALACSVFASNQLVSVIVISLNMTMNDLLICIDGSVGSMFMETVRSERKGNFVSSSQDHVHRH